MTVHYLNKHPDRFLKVPQAHSVEMFKCETCPNIHVVLFDKNGKPFAQFVYGPEWAAKHSVFVLSHYLEMGESK